MLTTIDFVAGDVINVHQKIREGEKTRIQVFKGTVIGIRGRGENKMFTVLKKSGQYYIERIWPVNSPNIEKVEVVETELKNYRNFEVVKKNLLW